MAHAAARCAFLWLALGCLPGSCDVVRKDKTAKEIAVIDHAGRTNFQAKHKATALQPEPEATSAEKNQTSEDMQLQRKPIPEDHRLYDPIGNPTETHKVVSVVNKSATTPLEINETELPEGSDIWNTSTRWTKVSQWHPKGVISNLDEYDKEPIWNEVSYVSVYMIFVCSALAYPVLVVTAMFFFCGHCELVPHCTKARPRWTTSGRLRKSSGAKLLQRRE